MPIPCVIGNQAGLAIFQATADQRHALGEDVFLATHAPVRFWKAQAGKRETWTEEDLLRDILTGGAQVRGNRVYLLFGAAGSGKSEVMRWLMCRLATEAPDRMRFAVRISRTELDPVQIVHRLLSAFQFPGLDRWTLERWSLLRNKPVAVANHLVWQALVGVCENDEEILPLSYRLRPVIESNLRSGFAAIDTPERAAGPLQLLSEEQLEQALSDMVLPAAVSYEQLRSLLQDAFDDLVLGGVRLVPALRAISQQVRAEHGVRPILIIDDLVQSMNVYASDLLDYLITLEEGEWDVVVGLTPASFDADRRGRELLRRIRELDTFDDRVTKLELSDTAGEQSAFLDRESAAAFLLPYLAFYKKASGFHCGSTCPHWSRCMAFQWNGDGDARLAPFNGAFLSRLWDALPAGKGKARYLLLAARDVLATVAAKGADALVDLPAFVHRDQFVEHADRRVKALLECYAPPQSHAITIPEALKEIWQVRVPERTLLAQPLVAEKAEGQLLTRVESDHAEVDPVLVAVRDWIEGAASNRELLAPLRVGAARLIKDLVDPGLLAGRGRPQCAGVLRWSAVVQGAPLPVGIEGLEEPYPLQLPRALGSAAFQLVAYSTVSGPARRALLQRLLSEPAVVELLYQAEALRGRWQDELATGLGCTVPDLAFHLYRILVALGEGGDGAVLCLGHERGPAVSDLAWPPGIWRSVEALFRDCFMIREHLWDGYALQERVERYPRVEDSLAALEAVLQKVRSVPLRGEFRLGEESVQDFLLRVHAHLTRVRRYALEQMRHLPERRRVAETYLSLADGRRRRALQRRLLRLQAASQGVFVTPTAASVLLAPAQERKQAASLLQALLNEATGELSLLMSYRLAAQFERAMQYKSVADLVAFREALCRLLEHLQAQGQPIKEEGVPLSTIALLEKIEALMHRCVPHISGTDAAVAPVLRQILALLTPAGFQVREWLWTDPGGPTDGNLAALVQAVRKASAWWRSYVHQLAELAARTPEGVADAQAFLADVHRLRLPGTAALRKWRRFLRRMRSAGIVDLPVRMSRTLENLPLPVQDWLVTRAEGATLAEVEPALLCALQEHAPQVARLLRITFVPEATDDGVFRVVDGQ